MPADHKNQAGKQAGIARLVSATRWSLAGLAAAYRHEASFRQEVWLAAVLVPLGVALGGTGVERALLVGSVLLVLVAELLNSAIETALDRFSPEWDELAGRAKDIGSAAVMLSLVNVAAIWLLVLL
jgi:diacylglycerol kinase (ATP)